MTATPLPPPPPTPRLSASRQQIADAVKAQASARYWPFGVFLYLLLATFTVGIGLWIVWALQEKRAGTSTGQAWLKALGFTLLCFLPFGYIIVAATYGRNLFYVSRPEAQQFL